MDIKDKPKKKALPPTANHQPKPPVLSQFKIVEANRKARFVANPFLQVFG